MCLFFAADRGLSAELSTLHVGPGGQRRLDGLGRERSAHLRTLPHHHSRQHGMFGWYQKDSAPAWYRKGELNRRMPRPFPTTKHTRGRIGCIAMVRQRLMCTQSSHVHLDSVEKRRIQLSRIKYAPPSKKNLVKEIEARIFFISRNSS